jgi:hypothetical protein
MSDDTELLKKIDAAAEAVNASEKIIKTAQAEVETAQTEHVPKCKALGLALLELKKLYPKVEDFEAKLKQCRHVKLSTAYDYMRLVGGRKTDEEIRQAEQERKEAARLRKQKSRSKPPKPEPKPVSVTEPNVTERSGEIDIEEHKRRMAGLDRPTEEKDKTSDAIWLAKFAVACKACLPQLQLEKSRQQARQLVEQLTATKAKAA